jgi:hypothetical protein
MSEFNDNIILELERFRDDAEQTMIRCGELIEQIRRHGRRMIEDAQERCNCCVHRVQASVCGAVWCSITWQRLEDRETAEICKYHVSRAAREAKK